MKRIAALLVLLPAAALAQSIATPPTDPMQIAAIANQAAANAVSTTLVDVVKDSNGVITGLVRANGVQVPVSPQSVPTAAAIDGSGVLTFTVNPASPASGAKLTAGNVVGPQGSMGPLNTSNTLAYQRVAGGSGTIQMSGGVAVLYITGTNTIVAQTVKLPANPTDGQFVRISTQQPITLLTVQDASGNAVGTAFALAVLSSGGLYQYQAFSSSWVRIA